MLKPDAFDTPPGFTFGHFKNAKGLDVRYGQAPCAPGVESKGTIVILPGFRENIEKYNEVMRDMQARGFDLFIMDWPGQGGSERLVKANPEKAHSDGYNQQVDTLQQFMDTIVTPAAKKPLVMLAHSMGAHLGLRYLNEQPGVFDSAMLSSPMIDIVTAGLPKPLARQMAKFAKAGNYLEKYIPGGTDWVEEKFQGNNKTSDPERYQAYTDFVVANDFLKIGDPTYGWIYHTFSSIDVLADEDYLKNIKTPILMEITDHDKIVERAAQDRALKFLPDAKVVEIKGAKHEIWMERDELRDVWLQKVDEFLGERLKLAATPAPKKPKPPGNPRPPAP